MSRLFGIIAVFETVDALRDAVRRAREAGFSAIEVYTPIPVEDVDRLVHPGRKWGLPVAMLGGAVFGACYGYWIQAWGEVVDYPINVGGRPYNSWPAFTVGAFEFMLLCAVTAGLVGMIVASGLPRLHHPLFDAKSFARSSRDRFVICIEASDPHFDPPAISGLFRQLGAESIEEVPT